MLNNNYFMPTKRFRYTAAFKLEAVQKALEMDPSVHEAALHLQVPYSNLQRWIQTEGKILLQPSHARQARRSDAPTLADEDETEKEQRLNDDDDDDIDLNIVQRQQNDQPETTMERNKFRRKKFFKFTPQPSPETFTSVANEHADEMNEHTPLLFIESFYTGSHQQLLTHLRSHLDLIQNYASDLVTLLGKKFHWRIRTSALSVSQLIARSHSYEVLFVSSCLNLAELLGLRPDIHACYKILYFHENQLVYPALNAAERDYQFGYSQIVSALAADCVVFNSNFNRSSFLDHIPAFLRKSPDFPDPTTIVQTIASKSHVIYFPIERPRNVTRLTASTNDDDRLHIIWPHRWEHDKNPEVFFDILHRLLAEGFTNFKLSIVGEQFDKTHPIFTQYNIEQEFRAQLVHIGYLSNKSDYYAVLEQPNSIVVSTAIHEFFGVAMMEAAVRGCFPLVPNRVVYPELYPGICRYNTDQQLFKRLKQAIRYPKITNEWWKSVDKSKFTRYYEPGLLSQYRKLLRLDE